MNEQFIQKYHWPLMKEIITNEDRLAMIKYKIDDIRLLFANDLRFLKQF